MCRENSPIEMWIYLGTGVILTLECAWLAKIVLFSKNSPGPRFPTCLGRCRRGRRPGLPRVSMRDNLLAAPTTYRFALPWYRVYLIGYAVSCGVASGLQFGRMAQAHRDSQWGGWILQATQIYAEHLPLEGLLFNLLFVGEGWRSWTRALVGGNMFAALTAGISLACSASPIDEEEAAWVVMGWRLCLSFLYLLVWKRPCCKPRASRARPRRLSVLSVGLCSSCRGRESLRYLAKPASIVWFLRAISAILPGLMATIRPESGEGYKIWCVDDIVSAIALILAPFVVMNTLTKDSEFWAGLNHTQGSRQHERPGESEDIDLDRFNRMTREDDDGDKVYSDAYSGPEIVSFRPKRCSITYFRRMCCMNKAQRLAARNRDLEAEYYRFPYRNHNGKGNESLVDEISLESTGDVVRLSPMDQRGTLEMTDSSAVYTTPSARRVDGLYVHTEGKHDRPPASIDRDTQPVNKEDLGIPPSPASWSQSGGQHFLLDLTGSRGTGERADPRTYRDSLDLPLPVGSKDTSRRGKLPQKKRKKKSLDSKTVRRYSQVASLRTPLDGFELTSRATRATAKHLDRLPAHIVPVLDYKDLRIYRSKGEQILLGTGSNAKVFHGTYQDTHEVAIKMVYTPEPSELEIENLLHEAGLLGHVQGDNIVALVGVCIAPPMICFVMEFCDGGSLFDQLHRRSSLPLHTPRLSTPTNMRLKLEIAKQCAQAVAWLHCQSPPVVHGDIKSGNFLLTRRGDLQEEGEEGKEEAELRLGEKSTTADQTGDDKSGHITGPNDTPSVQSQGSWLDESNVLVKLADLEWSRGMCGFTGTRTPGRRSTATSPLAGSDKQEKREEIKDAEAPESKSGQDADLRVGTESSLAKGGESTTYVKTKSSKKKKRFRLSLKRSKKTKPQATEGSIPTSPQQNPEVSPTLVQDPGSSGAAAASGRGSAPTAVDSEGFSVSQKPQRARHRRTSSINSAMVSSLGSLSIENVHPATVGHLTPTPEAYPWLPPERFSFRGNESEATEAGDVYALAVVLWEILFGLVPFHREQVFHEADAKLKGSQDPKLKRTQEQTQEEFIATIESGECILSFPSDFPVDLREILLLAWNTDPSKRPTAAQICATLSRQEDAEAGRYDGGI